jgi:hypothetical protein
MKKLIFMILIAGFSGILFVSSCKKKTTDPQYPQLVGSWKGNTSQSFPIQISIENFNGVLKMTGYGLSYSSSPGSSDSIHQYDSDGLAELSGTSFKFNFENNPSVYIDGSFKLDTLRLNGTFKVTDPGDPNNPVTGTYAALRQ